MTIDFWIKAVQLILSLSLLVFVHELGHFMFARLFKVRVDKFYLFFNKSISLIRFKKIKGKWQVKFFSKNVIENQKVALDSAGNPLLWENDEKENVRKKWQNKAPLTDKEWNKIEQNFNFGNKINCRQGHPKFTVIEEEDLALLPDDDWRKYPETTEWGIGWIPLGGYCKIAGMVDESMDFSTMKSKPKVWEYRSRPAWQRLFIIVGGVLMNFFTAIVIYAMMLYAWGKETLPLENAYLGYDYCQTALNNGIKNGDRIIAIDNEIVISEKEVVEKIVIEGKSNILLQREGKDTLVVLPNDFGEQMLTAEEKQFMVIRIPFVIESVVGQNKMLQAGDSVVGFNGLPLAAFSDLASAFEQHKNEKVVIEFVRQGEWLQDSVIVDENGKMGVALKNPMVYFKTESERFGFFASFPAGWNLGVETLESYIKQFRLVFTKAGAKSLGGFAAIGNLFPASWNWQIFWNMTAFLSIILAFMNILPIPVLDGGYVLFLLYEIIVRRKPSDRFMEVALNIGMFLLLALLIFANGNDILRFF